MPERVSETELKAIEERCAKATRGPWKSERRFSNGCEIVPRITCTPDDDRGCGWIADMVGAPYLGHKTTLPNAEFVASSREDLPACVREIRRLREEAQKNDENHWLNNRSQIEKEIVGMLKSTISAHGAITNETVSSAAKRVYSMLKDVRRRNTKPAATKQEQSNDR